MSDTKKTATYGCSYDHKAHTWVCLKDFAPGSNVEVPVVCEPCPQWVHWVQVCAKLKTWNVHMEVPKK